MSEKINYKMENSYKEFLSSIRLDQAKRIISSIIDFEKSRMQQRNHLLNTDELINLAEVYLTQKFFEKLILNEKFTVALISSTVDRIPIRYPLKKEWIELISSENIPISSRRSSFLFRIFRLKTTLWEIKNGIKNTKLISKIDARISTENVENHYQFVNGMHPVTILQQDSGPDSETFKNWLIENKKNPEEKTRIEFLEADPINGRDILYFFSNIFHYIKWLSGFVSFKNFFIAIKFLNLTRMLQISVLLLSDRVISTHKVTLFMEGGYGIVKELWMSKSNKKNYDSIVVFTSASIEPEDQYEAYSGAIKKYSLSSWDRLFVIDQNHKNRFIEYAGLLAEKIEVVGPIYWTDIDYSLHPNKKSLAVFDTEPQINSYHLNRLFKYGYNNIDNNIVFLTTIFSICQDLGIHVIFKSKRYLTYKRYPKYQEFLDRYVNNLKHLERIPEYVAASRVIRSCDLGTVALPCSTTALISEKYGKPSVYYDPISSLKKFGEINGIPVIHGEKELRDYLIELIGT